MIQLNHRDPRPIYEQIKDSLCKLVVSAAIKADEKLPSVRELATTLAINPNTIQRAYRELEAEGYIYTISGKGSFAAPRDSVVDIYKDELFESFDKTAKELFAMGLPPSQLADRLEQLYRKENDC